MELVINKSDESQKKYLVYSSAGDASGVRSWCGKDKNYDIWITYYGSGKDSLIGCSEIYNERSGGKFQNLKYIYENYRSVLDAYDYIAVFDDDIIIKSSEVNYLFDLVSSKCMWVLQPAFDPRGKVSYKYMIWKPGYLLRYSNFIEMNVPIFRKDKLFDFLEVYDGSLVGYGVDVWYSHFFSLEGGSKKMGICDVVKCINPLDSYKPGGLREISKLQSDQKRKDSFKAVKAKYGISMKTDDARVVGHERRSFPVFLVMSSAGFIYCYFFRLIYKIRRSIRKRIVWILGGSKF
ncbi:MAG: hypothetical protein U0998_00110 [Moraxellaceae bacterium]|nr:hypothetical protein [Moraxellaceae bacterium]MDZ4385606.1 hypothetical protein [Moraxellaceae bacterium]